MMKSPLFLLLSLLFLQAGWISAQPCEITWISETNVDDAPFVKFFSQGGFIFAEGQNYVQVWDNSNPAEPFKAGGTPNMAFTCGDTSRVLRDVAHFPNDSILFLASECHGIKMFEVASNPIKPKEKASINRNTINGIASFINGTGERYVVFPGGTGLTYVDCSNPDAPGEILTFTGIAKSADKLFGFKYGTKSYLALMAQNVGGFALYDVTNFPDSAPLIVEDPQCRGYYAFHRNGRIYVMGRQGLGSNWGLRVFSVTSGNFLGAYQGADFGEAMGVTVDDHYAYLGLGDCASHRGLDIVNIEDPSNMYSVLPTDFEMHNCGYLKVMALTTSASGGFNYFMLSSLASTQVYKMACGDYPNVVLNGYSPSAMDPTGNPVTLTITLKNTGTASVTASSVHLSTSYAGVTVNAPNPQNYGTLAPGQSASRDFSVTVGTSTQPGTATFNLDINSGDFALEFDVSINAPHPNLVRSVTKGAADVLQVTYTNTGNADYTGTFQANLTSWTAGVTLTPPANITFGPVAVGATTPAKSYAYTSSSDCPAGVDFLSVHMTVTDPTVNNSPADFNVNLTGTGLHPLILYYASSVTKAGGVCTLTLGLRNGGDASGTAVQVTQITADNPNLTWTSSFPVTYGTMAKNQKVSKSFTFTVPDGTTGNVHFTASVDSGQGCWQVAFVQNLADVQFSYVDEKHCGCGGKCMTLHPDIYEGDDVNPSCVEFSFLLSNTGSSVADGVTATLEDRNNNPNVSLTQGQSSYTIAAGAQAYNSPVFKVTLSKDYCPGDDSTCPKLQLRLRIPDYNFAADLPDYTVLSTSGGGTECVLSVKSGSLTIVSTGDGDTTPEPNEFVNFTVEIQNTGDASASGVSGTLSEPTGKESYVTLNTDTVSFGTIAAGSSARNGTPFKFTLSEDAVTGTYSFPIEMASSCRAGEPFTGSIPISVSSSGGTIPLTYESFTVDDSATGDNEGDLDKGEAVTLIVTLRNDSGSPIQSKTATLSSTASGVNITSQGTFSALPNQTGSASFGVNLSSSYSSGEVPFTIQVQDAVVTGGSFSVPVGTTTIVNLYRVDEWVDDADDIWKPGETVTLVVSLRNDSAVLFDQAATTLTPMAPTILVNSQGTYSAAAGATAAVLYEVYLPSEFKGNSAAFEIAVTGATSILPSDMFSIPVDQQSGVVHSLVVPVVAHAGGVQNTNWKSDVVIRNTTDVDLEVTLLLIKSSAENTAPPQATFTITPGTPLVLRDVLNCADLPAFQGNSRGSLLIRYSGSYPPAVTSRTYNDLGNQGTYGQSVPAVQVDSSARGTGGSYPSNLFGLVKSTSFRSNLGVANIMGVENKIKVTLYDSSGTIIGSPAEALLGAYNMAQVDDILAAVSGDSNLQSAAFWAKVESESTPPVDFAAYASIVDNQTGDGSFVSDQIHGFSVSLIPGVAHATGANSTIWKTDLNLYNPSSAEATVKLTYFPYGANDGTSFTKSGTVPAQGTMIVNDILTIFSGLNPQEAGFLVAETLGATGEEVLLSSRTYNDQGTKGTYGQYIPSLDLSSDGGREAQKMFIPGLSSSSAFRVNVGLVNGDSDGAALAQMTLRNSNGSVMGNKDYYLGLSYSGTQIANATLLADMGIAQSFENATLEVTVGGDNLFVYASSVDNITGDPIFLLPVIK